MRIQNLFDSDKNKVRLNNQTYEISIVLSNIQGSFFPLNTSGIESFVIEEDSRKWYKEGHIIIKNSDHVIERRPNEFFDEKNNYKFRNDGRDFLFVSIRPIDETINTPGANSTFTPEFWELNYAFVVYDVEDIAIGNTTDKKNIKLYFWELDYQYFLETVNSWNTNNVLYNLYPELNGRSSILSDEERKVPTGLAIKQLIEDTLNEKTDIQKFSEYWDPGASKIFYTSPTNNSAIEDLNYLLNRHTSSHQFYNIEGDVPLLFRNRYNKTWHLMSFSKFFKNAVTNGTKAGPLQLEQFLINTRSTFSSIIPVPRKTPQDPDGVYNVNLGILGSVTNYQFVDMSALDNIFLFVNTPCASNSIKNKQFKIEFEENTIESIKDYFQKNYVDPFAYFNKPTALLTLNKNKTESKTLQYTYSYGTEKRERYPESRNMLLKAGLFLNECLSFTVPGSTYRQSNSFIGLDRSATQVDSTFDAKLLGQWYVFKVVHDFSPVNNTYTNTIVAVKPFASKDLRITDSVV